MPNSASVALPTSPSRPPNRMTRNPTTTPGKASGKVSSDNSRLRPANRRLASVWAAIVPSARVVAVVTSDRTSVAIRLSR